MSEEDIVIALTKLSEAQGHIKSLQDEILSRQKEANGSVRDLLAWKRGHEVLHDSFNEKVALGGNSIAKLTNDIQRLMDLHQQAAIVKREERKFNKIKEKALWFSLALGSSLLSSLGFRLPEILKHLPIK